MIDWLTLRYPGDRLSEESRAALRALHGRMICVSPDGVVEWESPRRVSIRSDSHQITIHLGTDLELTGSPARVMDPEGLNVFGSMDIRACAEAMQRFAQGMTGIALPVGEPGWRVTRVDIALNYDLGSSANVRAALSYLRQSEGGRYQLRTAAETTYWSSRSALRRGKAYGKGFHLSYQRDKGQITCTDDQIDKSSRLLRLELTLASQYWRERAEKPWHDWTEADLIQAHHDYFSPLIGDTTVMQTDDILPRLEDVAPSPGQALSAYRTWALVRTLGVREAQASMPKRTWYRHKRLLNAAGLRWGDFHAGEVVPIRRRPILLEQPVTCWGDIAA